MELYEARCIWDSIARRRVIVAWGRDLVVPVGSDIDPEKAAWNRGLPTARPGYELKATIEYQDVKGWEGKARSLVRQNLTYPGPNPDWALDRMTRWLVPSGFPSGIARLIVMRNDGRTSEILCDVTPDRQAVGMRVETSPLYVTPDQPLSGVYLDLRRYMGSDAAINITGPNCSVSDVVIDYPHGRAFSGANMMGLTLERVRANCLEASGFDIRMAGAGVFNEVEFSGKGGFRAGQFGLMWSGGGSLMNEVRISGFSRGPLWFPIYAEMARDCMADVTLSDILPSQGESEGFLKEHSQCALPPEVKWAGRTLTAKMLMVRDWQYSLARVGCHVANLKTKQWARIVSAKVVDAQNWEIVVDRDIGEPAAGDCHIGPMAVENLAVRVIGRDVRSVFSIAGPSADNAIVDCRATRCEEPMETYIVGGPIRQRDGVPNVYANPFSWRDYVKFPEGISCVRKAVKHVNGLRTAPLPGRDGQYSWGADWERVHGVGEVKRA